MINPILWLVLTVIDLYIWVVIISVVLSWLVAFNVVNTSNRLIYMVGDITHRLTEPALGRIRRFIPILGGMDLSTIALLIGLVFLQKIIIWGSYQLG